MTGGAARTIRGPIGSPQTAGVAASRPPAAPASPAAFTAGATLRTTGLLNRLDPRQPSEAEICATAAAALEAFGGDLGAARLWAIDEAIRLQAAGDRRRNLIAVRLSRALKALACRG